MANTNSNSINNINNITSKVPKSLKGIAVFGFGSIVPMQLFYNHVKQQQLQPSYRNQFQAHQQQLQFSSLSSSNFNNMVSTSNPNTSANNNNNNNNNANMTSNTNIHNVPEIESPINKEDTFSFNLKSNSNNLTQDKMINNRNDMNTFNNFNTMNSFNDFNSVEYSLVSTPTKLSSKESNMMYNELNFNKLHQLPSNIISSSNNNNSNSNLNNNSHSNLNNNSNDLFSSLNENLFNEVIKRAEIKQLAWEVNDINF